MREAVSPLSLPPTASLLFSVGIASLGTLDDVEDVLLGLWAESEQEERKKNGEDVAAGGPAGGRGEDGAGDEENGGEREDMPRRGGTLELGDVAEVVSKGINRWLLDAETEAWSGFGEPPGTRGKEKDAGSEAASSSLPPLVRGDISLNADMALCRSQETDDGE